MNYIFMPTNNRKLKYLLHISITAMITASITKIATSTVDTMMAVVLLV